MSNGRNISQRETRAFYQILDAAGSGHQLIFSRNLSISFQPDEFIVKQIQYNKLDTETGTVGFILNSDLVLQPSFSQIGFFSQNSSNPIMLNNTFSCTKTNLNFCTFWISQLPNSDLSLNTQQEIVTLSSPIADTDLGGTLFVLIEFVKYQE